MNFLFGLGQVVCIVGLLYGAWLSLKCGVQDEFALRPRVAPPTAPRKPGGPLTGYDTLTGHSWRTNPPLT